MKKDSNIGRDIFLFVFQEVLKFVHAQVWFLAVWFFKFSKFHLLKGRRAKLSIIKNVRVKKNVIDF